MDRSGRYKQKLYDEKRKSFWYWHMGNFFVLSSKGEYFFVFSGIDFSSVLNRWQSTDGAAAATTAAPFVVAYAIHKVFAPVRISITLVSVPFIVKYLRRIGFVKPPKPSSG